MLGNLVAGAVHTVCADQLPFSECEMKLRCDSHRQLSVLSVCGFDHVKQMHGFFWC